MSATLQALSAWFDRVATGLSGLSAKPQFRAWAARFPLTRPIARRRARQLFDLCAGFVYSQVLLACVRLRIFRILADGPQTLEALALRVSLSHDATARLLAAAVALRLLVCRRDRRYVLGPLGAALIGNEAVLAMIEHHAVLYRDLSDPVQLLRHGAQNGELAQYWPYAAAPEPGDLNAPAVAAYSALMSSSQPLVSDEILNAYSLRKHRCLLDVGGGEGAFAAAAAARSPQLRVMLFDLPAVAELARKRLTNSGLNDRVEVFGGSFLKDALPDGADIVSLVRVLHDHDDDAVRSILRAIRRVLPAQGVLLVAEPMAGTSGAEAMGDAYFGFYLLAMGKGRARTAAELGSLLQQCGFDSGRLVRNHLPIQTRLLVAKPSGNG